LAAGVYVALISGTVLLCLIGALVLPGSISFIRWLGLFGMIGIFLGAPVLDRLAHRSRIRDAVREIVGNVIRIRRLPFWRQDDPGWLLPIARRIKYRVDYRDAEGSLHRALCRSGWFHGVEWLEDAAVDPENIE